MEEWRDIKDYKGSYQVSNTGRVRSLDRYVASALKHNSQIRRKGRIITNKNLPNGYHFVFLYNGTNPNGKMFLIHRLVAEAFIPNDMHVEQVNHIDGIKINNLVNNLEWVTAKGNKAHAMKHGLVAKGEKIGNSKLNEMQVRVIRRCKNLVPSRYIGDLFGTTSTNVCDIWNYKTWKGVTV